MLRNVIIQNKHAIKVLHIALSVEVEIYKIWRTIHFRHDEVESVTTDSLIKMLYTTPAKYSDDDSL